jgi:hypothetical protein
LLSLKKGTSVASHSKLIAALLLATVVSLPLRAGAA